MSEISAESVNLGLSNNTNNKRRALVPLQQSAVGQNRLFNKLRDPTKKTVKQKSSQSTSNNYVKHKKFVEQSTQTSSARVITEEDLTSTGPVITNDYYWEVLIDRRNMAIENAMQRNRALLETLEIRLKENSDQKEKLAQLTAAIEVLTEAIEERRSAAGG